MEITLIKIATILLSALPVSLIIIELLQKIFARNEGKLANATCICSDIQGILLKDVLIVKTLIFENNKVLTKENSNLVKIINEETNADFSVESSYLQQQNSTQLIAAITHLCHYQKTEKIENIISLFFKTCGLGKDRTEKNYEIIEKIPTNEYKRLSAIVALNNESKEVFSFVKGNPGTILKKCSRVLIEGRKIEMTSQLRRKLRKKAEKLNSNGEKVIAYAYKGLPKKILSQYEESFVENDLILIGMIGLGNPLNQEITQSIQKAKDLGLKIYVLTKLRERKAIFCANEFGIINPAYFENIHGSYLENLGDQKIKKMLMNREKDFVFSGLKDNEKILIMEILRSLGETIAVTSRNEKDPFKVITDIIEKNKRIHGNKNRVRAHAISCKIAEIILVLAAVFLNAPIALSIIMIIGIDILINLHLEFALRMNKVEKEKKFLSYILINGLSLGIILITAFFFNLFRYGWNWGDSSLSINDPAILKSMTSVFLILSLTQIISAFSLRNQNKSILSSSPFSNIYLVLTIVIGFLFLYAIMSIGPLRQFFGLTGLSSMDWQIIGFALIGFVVIEELRKFLINHKWRADI